MVSFKFARDNDCHWFIINADDQERFDRWVEAMDNDEDSPDDFDEFMIDGDPTHYILLAYPEQT